MWKALTMYHLLLGLDLSGTVVGLNMEHSSAMYEFTLANKPYGYTLFSLYGVVDNFAQVGYVYVQPNIQRMIFTGRAYAKDDFQFLGTDWKWGLGGGMNVDLQNQGVTLIDSTVLNALRRVETYGSLATFLVIYFGDSYSEGLKLTGDMRLRWPPEGQISLVFMIKL